MKAYHPSLRKVTFVAFFVVWWTYLLMFDFSELQSKE